MAKEQNKYPLDAQAIEEMSRDILLHDRAQQKMIHVLMGLLGEAMSEPDVEDSSWYEDAKDILSSLSKRKMDFENHRFNQSNGYNVKEKSPYQPSPEERKITNIDLMTENELNAIEAGFGEEMNEDELASLFGEKKPKKKKKTKKIEKMSLEEIESWEAAQENSNDIYKVSARIKNSARMAVKANLTAQGDMVVNTFTHLIKALYDFADTIKDRETKVKLVELTKKQEELPGNLLVALGAGVTLKK
jgi:hypothetical protein